MMDASSQPATGEALLQMVALGGDRFRACRNQDNFTGSLFGGQLLGQALAAAQRTAGAFPANHVAGYFLRPGDARQPVEYEVHRVSESRRYALRRVIARQDNRQIFEATCSFHEPESGFEHAAARAAEIPGPDGLISLNEFGAAHAEQLPRWLQIYLSQPFPIEIRPLDVRAMLFDRPERPGFDFWFRLRAPGRLANPHDHQSLLSLMSDYWLSIAALAPHRTVASPSATPRVSTIGHMVWFHACADAGQWLFFRTSSPWAGGGRGLVQGLIHDRAGRLVATVMQELSIREPTIQAKLL